MCDVPKKEYHRIQESSDDEQMNENEDEDLAKIGETQTAYYKKQNQNGDIVDDNFLKR